MRRLRSEIWRQKNWLLHRRIHTFSWENSCKNQHDWCPPPTLLPLASSLFPTLKINHSLFLCRIL
jgi:hypothetical protein